jgi:hypothetical protein
VLQDLRYASRLLVRTPAFTVVAVATLALGIGTNAAMFSVVNATLLNPLPYPDSSRLVLLSSTVQRDTLERRGFSYADFRDLRARTQTFDAVAAFSGESFTVSSADIGVRLALGAGRLETYRLVMTDALRLTVAGLAIGAIAAVPAARLLSSQLYGVTPTDPVTYGVIMSLLLIVGIFATLVPARRASRVDPIVALRAD